MIKTFTLFASLFILSNVHGQIAKKSYLLGGDVSYVRSEVDRPPANQFAESVYFSIFLGKAIKENTVVGTTLTLYPLNKSHYISGTDSIVSRSKGFEVGPYFRKYKTIAKDLNLFADLETAIGIYTIETEGLLAGNDYEINSWLARFSIAPGISYKILKKLHVQAKIPNLLRIEYRDDERNYRSAQFTDESAHSFEFRSSLTNLISLGSMVVGFYFEL